MPASRFYAISVHAQVMALDMHVAAGFGQAYATAEAPATHPQVPDSIPPAHKLCRRCHVRSHSLSLQTMRLWKVLSSLLILHMIAI